MAAGADAAAEPAGSARKASQSPSSAPSPASRPVGRKNSRDFAPAVRSAATFGGGGSGPSSSTTSPPGGGARRPARDSPLLVLKVGTSTLMASDGSGQRVRLANFAQMVELIGELRRRGYTVVLISSGAVGMGCIKLGIRKPTDIRVKQAVAAAGQSHLMRMYEDMFNTVGLNCAQLLISQLDFMDKQHWSNVKHTLIECLKLGVVPVINENDCTNTQELRFGDNDNLAALTAVQLEADGLFLFTDVDYLYTANPRTDPAATPLRVVEEPWALSVDTQNAGSGLGTGGMSTKIIAARTASTAGIPCGLINGEHPRRVLTFLDYGVVAARPVIDGVQSPAPAKDAPVPEGTFFKAMVHDQTVGETRRWILSLPVGGELVLDDGAARAIANHKSLLPIGVLKVQGRFLSNECVKICHRGSEIGRAIVNFTSEELTAIRGRHSKDFEDILGYATVKEGCFRDNIVLTVLPETLRSFDVLTKLPDPVAVAGGGGSS